MRFSRRKKRHGVAIIIALFTVFAILTMGVTYIGLSFTNSRASEGYEREAMAISFANAGLEFALNMMGRPACWDAQGVVLSTDFDNGDFAEGGDYPPFAIRAVQSGDAIWNDYFNHPDTGLRDIIQNYGRIIETQNDLEQYGIIGSPGLFGHWSILVFPEEFTGGVPRYNINYRIVVRSWIRGDNQTGSTAIASREIMARVSNEFPGSIYQNLRSYDACGGFGYPNDTELTSDAVFVTEDFNWDGGIRIDGDGADDGTHRTGKPWENPDFSGPGFSDKDTSGSLKISLLDPDVDDSKWPNFKGKLITQQSNKGTTEPGSGNSIGILYDNNIDDLGQVFTNSKDPYQTGVPSINIMDSDNGIWVANDGSSSRPKLGFYGTGGAAEDGFFYNTTVDGGNGTDVGYQIEAADDTLKLDPFGSYNTYEAPTYRITVVPLRENIGGEMKVTATGFFVQELYRDKALDNTNLMRGELTPTGTSKYFYVKNDSPETVRTPANSDGVNWDQIVYVKGGSVQVFGGDAQDLGWTPNANATYGQLVTSGGDPGDGHLTVPVSIVADTNINRDYDISQSLQNGTVEGRFDSRLTTANVWDNNTGKYVFQCYDQDGHRIFKDTEAPVKEDAIWQFSYNQVTDGIPALRDLENDTSGRYEVRFPPPPETVNQQQEGNLSVIGDLAYRKGIESPSLGLLAKNHVLLNDYQHPDPTDGQSYDTDPEDGLPENQTLELDATIGSQNHSVQMDFFNFNHNQNAKVRPDTGTGGPTTGNVNASDTAPPSVVDTINGVSLENVSGGYDSVNKWTSAGMTRARDQYWQDFWFGSDQTCNDTWQNYNYIYQSGKFQFNGSIISRFADVEADAGKGDDPNVTGTQIVPGVGYVYQAVGYDPNLKNRSAPYFSTSCYNKKAANAIIYWSVLTYVDRGAFSEVTGY